MKSQTNSKPIGAIEKQIENLSRYIEFANGDEETKRLLTTARCNVLKKYALQFTQTDHVGTDETKRDFADYTNYIHAKLEFEPLATTDKTPKQQQQQQRKNELDGFCDLLLLANEKPLIKLEKKHIIPNTKPTRSNALKIVEYWKYKTSKRYNLNSGVLYPASRIYEPLQLSGEKVREFVKIGYNKWSNQDGGGFYPRCYFKLSHFFNHLEKRVTDYFESSESHKQTEPTPEQQQVEELERFYDLLLTNENSLSRYKKYHVINEIKPTMENALKIVEHWKNKIASYFTLDSVFSADSNSICDCLDLDREKVEKYIEEWEFDWVEINNIGGEKRVTFLLNKFIEQLDKRVRNYYSLPYTTK